MLAAPIPSVEGMALDEEISLGLPRVDHSGQSPLRTNEEEDDLDAMLNDIVLDQEPGGGLAWCESDYVALPPPAEVDEIAWTGDDPGAVLPRAQPDPRIKTQSFHQSSDPRIKTQSSVLDIPMGGRKPMNPLAAAVAERLEAKAREEARVAVHSDLTRGSADQDHRIHTQTIQPMVVAGQDYRVQTQAFPPGLLASSGIDLKDGQTSAVQQNESVMESVMDDVRNQRRRTVPEAEQMEPEMEDSWEGSSHTGSGSSRTGSFASGSHSRSSHSRSSRFEIGQAEADVRQRRNREAAKDYRRRKKEYVTELQANVKQLEREKKELAQRMDTLESENRKLQMMFASPEITTHEQWLQQQQLFHQFQMQQIQLQRMQLAPPTQNLAHAAPSFEVDRHVPQPTAHSAALGVGENDGGGRSHAAPQIGLPLQIGLPGSMR